MKRNGSIKGLVLFFAVAGMLTGTSCNDMSDKNDSDSMDDETELNEGNDMDLRDTMHRIDTMHHRHHMDTGMRSSSAPRNH